MFTSTTKWRNVAAAAWAALALHPVLAAPVEETRGDIAVLHGGIGEEDRAAMAQKTTGHNLRLTFARKGSGAYLSDVKVVIRDRKGAVVVDSVASGPWLYARLPDGDYSISATAQGSTQS